ncbi:CpsD/CapB family tyrosine-protein kinase [Paenibacillus sp. R14(2021)]|uniref:CpsD/CapB family tyrosine-protein kinase n=1 Tax=Paenibacillus sp. R14(2021) TaxID=2859228 RepID=UPI001C61549E|nr:CpsD/CapB family tyrosine-protein kinase [Paenibacillus sp. R14(2021)]
MLRLINRKALITDTNPKLHVSESFRALRTQLQFLDIEEPLQVISAVSSMPGEGKTTMLVNLGIAFAQAGRRVVILDGDMRRPAIHQIFNMDNRAGLSSYLRHSLELEDIVIDTHIENLRVIPSGQIPHNPSELLSSKRMLQLIAALREQTDILLIDSPPVLAVADSKIVAARCDGVILVVHAKRSKREYVKKAKDQLDSVKANVLGVVINGMKASSFKGMDYY